MLWFHSFFPYLVVFNRRRMLNRVRDKNRSENLLSREQHFNLKTPLTAVMLLQHIKVFFLSFLVYWGRSVGKTRSSANYFWVCVGPRDQTIDFHVDLPRSVFSSLSWFHLVCASNIVLGRLKMILFPPLHLRIRFVFLLDRTKMGFWLM